MPSTRNGSPTPPGSKKNYNVPDDDETFDQLGYALPRGVLSSSDSVAVTSASPSVNGGCSTPARGFGSSHVPSGSLGPASQAIHNSDSFHISDGPLEQLKRDLEANYQVQSNVRVQKFLVQFPGGVPEVDIERFKQKEAIERTKFVVYKDSQLAKLIKELNGVHHGPYVSPATPTPSHRFSTGLDLNHLTHHNPFRVNHQFPPPRSAHERYANANYGSGASFCSFAMPSSNSGVPESTCSGVDDGDSGLPNRANANINHATDASAPFTREQVVSAFEVTWKKIDEVNDEATQLRDQITELKQLLVALTGGSDLTSLTNRITVLERKLHTIQNGQPLESDAAFVANLESEVKLLSEKIASASMDTMSRRAFQTENELTKMTFNNKCALIEKYLGIDITTTGPKPHGVLEGIHGRIWHLEQFLNPEDPSCKQGLQYRPINDFMKRTLGKNNAVVNYSATPGYGNGGATPNTGAVSALDGLNLDSNSQAGATPVSSSPHRLSNLHGYISGMRFDPHDVRYRGNNTGGDGANHTTISGGGPVMPAQGEVPRRMSNTSLLPMGLMGPDYPTKSHRRSRAMSSRASYGVMSPKTRKIGGHSRANSTSTTKDTKDTVENATAGAVAPPQKTSDKAYRSWLNQRPGDFMGKKLTGPGEKE